MKNNNESIYKMTSVIDVANRFIELSLEDENKLTNLKLQKLVYIAYAFMLKNTNEKLFNEEICAFTYGPVVPDLYIKLKKYGKNEIINKLESLEELSLLNSKLIDFIFSAFKDSTPSELVLLTHMEGSAWKMINDRCGSNLSYLHPIEDKDIIFSNEPAVKLLNDFLDK